MPHSALQLHYNKLTLNRSYGTVLRVLTISLINISQHEQQKNNKDFYINKYTFLL